MHWIDVSVGVRIAKQGQPRERMSAGCQSMILGPNEAMNDDGFASLGQVAELASRIEE